MQGRLRPTDALVRWSIRSPAAKSAGGINRGVLIWTSGCYPHAGADTYPATDGDLNGTKDRNDVSNGLAPSTP